MVQGVPIQQQPIIYQQPPQPTIMQQQPVIMQQQAVGQPVKSGPVFKDPAVELMYHKQRAENAKMINNDLKLLAEVLKDEKEQLQKQVQKDKEEKEQAEEDDNCCCIIL